ncbi:hypothetical protein GXN76_12325 [Kroppenstedtia pulmonis]|uniref:Uncharacterized protein n=1 Tax=Kroppenstedtia pulmonis TaxID=1380685 RepID=A0A7D3XJZ8_9BACL|nr:hypothetical protein [Kroppenstedtia pulmonis]QKG85179.1 hypothetical protein GXN76_12325 [Kroppenstedtia pulmonis]
MGGRKRCRKQNREFKRIIRLLKILINKSSGTNIVINANPEAKGVGGANTETGPTTVAGNDVTQVASESGPGGQKANQLSKNKNR